MGITHLVVVLSIRFAPAVSILASHDTQRLRARKPIPDPKVGDHVKVMSDKKKYDKLCTEMGIMEIVEAGHSAAILELDIPEGFAKVVDDEDHEKGWVPIRSLVGFDKWCQPGKKCSDLKVL
jgi:hypothetical protein